MKKTFTRPAQLIKPFHRFTPAYANSLSSREGKDTQRKKETNSLIDTVPKAKKPKSKIRTANYWQLLTDHKTQLPHKKGFQNCQLPSMYPIQTRAQKTSKNKPHRYLLWGIGKGKILPHSQDKKWSSLMPVLETHFLLGSTHSIHLFPDWSILREYLREHRKAEYLLELDYA